MLKEGHPVNTAPTLALAPHWVMATWVSVLSLVMPYFFSNEYLSSQNFTGHSSSKTKICFKEIQCHQIVSQMACFFKEMCFGEGQNISAQSSKALQSRYRISHCLLLLAYRKQCVFLTLFPGKHSHPYIFPRHFISQFFPFSEAIQT